MRLGKGQSHSALMKMEVSMTGPFVRLGSKVDLWVKAKESPVKISDLIVQKIEIKNLSVPLTYYLGEKDWRPGAGYTDLYGECLE